MPGTTTIRRAGPDDAAEVAALVATAFAPLPATEWPLPQEPHHLTLPAVRPSLQGGGRGTALPRHHHAVLDETGTAAYLEAGSPGSRHLYARHGYEPRETFTLPDGTRFWPMWRPSAA